MNNIAKFLLETKSVHIEPNEEKFFTWTSGKRSPIYCDNRQLISYPQIRNEITLQFVNKIKEEYSDVELIAGTATAGIPWAALIAERLSLPMVYIRSKPKGHGLKSAIEGKVIEGQKTLIIEDLISTGKSSIEAYNHAMQDKLDVKAVLSIFSYGFLDANKRFEDLKLSKYSLCELTDLLNFAKETNALNQDQVNSINTWRENF